MEKIVVLLSAEQKTLVEINDFPELTSGNNMVRKGITMLKQYAPGLLRYLSKQRLMAHLPDYLIEIRGPGAASEPEARRILGSWMKRKRSRRLLYVILELLLMPFTAFVAILPGPNVVFYGLFVLFYFHFKAFLSLSRIRAEDLNISLGKNET